MSFNYTSMADFNANAQQQYKNTMDAFGQQLSTLKTGGNKIAQEYGQMGQDVQNWGQNQQYGDSQIYKQDLDSIQQGDATRGLTNTTIQNDQNYQAAGGYQGALLNINQAALQQRLGVQQGLAGYQAGLVGQEAGVYGAAANYAGSVGQVSQQLAGQQTLAEQQFGYNASLAAIQNGYARQAGGGGVSSGPAATQQSPYGFQVGAMPTAGGYIPGIGGSAYAPAGQMASAGGGADYGYGGGFSGGEG